MTDEIFISVCEKVFKEFQEVVPNPKTRYLPYYINAYGNRCKGSTGNMAFNASILSFPDSKTGKIVVDEKIAPYVPYTNEPWISPKWKGHKNPNEGWFDKSAEMVAKNLAKYVKGDLK